MTRAEIIEELHEIREKHYEEEKGLSVEEKVAKINQAGREVIKKYGLKFKNYSSTHN